MRRVLRALALASAAVVTFAPGALAAVPVTTGVTAATATAACPDDRPLTEVVISTVPVVPGARLDIDGQVVVTDAAGHATTSVCRLTSARDITGPKDPIQLPDHRRAVFDRVFLSGRGRVVQASFGMDHEVSFSFLGLPTRQIESYTLRSSTGEVITRNSLGPVYLPGSRVLRGPDGLEQRDIYYSVDAVSVAGSSVVNRSQVRFYPSERAVVRVPLLAFNVKVQVVDRLFGHPVGSAVRLTRPGTADVRRTLEQGVATFTEVPRGDYDVVAEAPGLRVDRSLVLSTNQVVVMPVLTWLDIVVLVGVPLALAVGLVLAPRPTLRRRLAELVPRPAWVSALTRGRPLTARVERALTRPRSPALLHRRPGRPR